jgi:hypothetical protein
MNVVDLPQPCTDGLYEEAARRYAAAVKSRAFAVYRSGDARYPALSGLELIVVTEHLGVDNRFFFSALQRLPQRYHRLFLHEPFILPAWSLRVMRYTSHSARTLVAGREVLSAYQPSSEPDERWCRVLESYCAFAGFVEKTLRICQLEGRHTIAVASALQRLTSDLAAVLPAAADGEYVSRIERIHRTFFDDDPVERVRETWTLFANAFGRFDAVLRAHLNATTMEDASSIARARLRGEEACADVDRGYAFRRARDIGGYHQELVSLGFPFGRLFFAPAYPQTPDFAGVPIVETLLHNLYRVRRRIAEHV